MSSGIEQLNVMAIGGGHGCPPGTRFVGTKLVGGRPVPQCVSDVKPGGGQPGGGGLPGAGQPGAAGGGLPGAAGAAAAAGGGLPFDVQGLVSDAGQYTGGYQQQTQSAGAAASGYDVQYVRYPSAPTTPATTAIWQRPTTARPPATQIPTSPVAIPGLVLPGGLTPEPQPAPVTATQFAENLVAALTTPKNNCKISQAVVDEYNHARGYPEESIVRAAISSIDQEIERIRQVVLKTGVPCTEEWSTLSRMKQFLQQLAWGVKPTERNVPPIPQAQIASRLTMEQRIEVGKQEYELQQSKLKAALEQLVRKKEILEAKQAQVEREAGDEARRAEEIEQRYKDAGFRAPAVVKRIPQDFTAEIKSVDKAIDHVSKQFRGQTGVMTATALTVGLNIDVATKVADAMTAVISGIKDASPVRAKKPIPKVESPIWKRLKTWSKDAVAGLKQAPVTTQPAISKLDVLMDKVADKIRGKIRRTKNDLVKMATDPRSAQLFQGIQKHPNQPRTTGNKRYDDPIEYPTMLDHEDPEVNLPKILLGKWGMMSDSEKNTLIDAYEELRRKYRGLISYVRVGMNIAEEHLKTPDLDPHFRIDPNKTTSEELSNKESQELQKAKEWIQGAKMEGMRYFMRNPVSLIFKGQTAEMANIGLNIYGQGGHPVPTKYEGAILESAVNELKRKYDIAAIREGVARGDQSTEGQPYELTPAEQYAAIMKVYEMRKRFPQDAETAIKNAFNTNLSMIVTSATKYRTPYSPELLALKEREREAQRKLEESEKTLAAQIARKEEQLKREWRDAEAEALAEEIGSMRTLLQKRQIERASSRSALMESADRWFALDDDARMKIASAAGISLGVAKKVVPPVREAVEAGELMPRAAFGPGVVSYRLPERPLQAPAPRSSLQVGLQPARLPRAEVVEIPMEAPAPRQQTPSRLYYSSVSEMDVGM